MNLGKEYYELWNNYEQLDIIYIVHFLYNVCIYKELSLKVITLISEKHIYHSNVMQHASIIISAFKYFNITNVQWLWNLKLNYRR